MTDPTTNPYAPPGFVPPSNLVPPRNADLLPLWIWLGIAVIASFVGTPADPVSMLIDLAYGLISFLVGAVLGSSLHIVLRCIPALLWCGVRLTLLQTPLATEFTAYYATVHVSYMATSIAFGYWASRRLGTGRFRILLWFSIGYALGSVVCVIGTVAGAVTGAFLARRSLASSRNKETTIPPLDA